MFSLVLFSVRVIASMRNNISLVTKTRLPISEGWLNDGLDGWARKTFDERGKFTLVFILLVCK